MQEIRKNIYILSDAHLGSLAIPHMRMQERRLVRFLDDIKHKAAAVYLLGDMFDFWYEWKYAVPKGYTRFLGKISELTDMGVEVHYFTGNHDIWMYGYLEQECGVILHQLFSMLHPRWSMWFGLTWAKQSRLKRENGKEPPYMGEDKEHLVLFTKEYLKSHDNIDYFIYGHRHIELDLMLSRKVRMMIIGDWISQFTYVVFDGEHLFLEEYVEGESKM